MLWGLLRRIAGLLPSPGGRVLAVLLRGVLWNSWGDGIQGVHCLPLLQRADRRSLVREALRHKVDRPGPGGGWLRLGGGRRGLLRAAAVPSPPALPAERLSRLL